MESSSRNRFPYRALTSGSRSASGGSVMKSILFCCTPVTCALLLLFCVTMILSTCASATSSAPASLTVLNWGLRSMVSVCGASTLVMVNGPLLGGGLLVASLSSGVVGGTGAANGSARIWSNVPFGSVRLTVMSPVASSVLIPLMVSALPSA